MFQITYLLFLNIILNMKNKIAERIPIPAKQVIAMYSGKGMDSSIYVTYVESRGMFPPEIY